MNVFRNIRERMNRFMVGRYGTDALNRGLLILWVVFLIIAFITGSLWLYIPQLILCLIIFWRMLSRNIVRRQRENHGYYELMKKIGTSWRRAMVRLRDRKTANFFRCPRCRADIRMPKQIGSFRIRCPKCGEEFNKTFR
ncbi:MAG: hypothetical protein J6Z79_06565 [Clostridia bacterium]|nr:hypothetical protein [Clostridia bacterium]